MQKIPKVIIALTALTFIIAVASSTFIVATFAAEDINGNRIQFPVPGWKQTGPSPWWFTAHHGNFNLSFTGFNEYSTAPKTPHILWKAQIGVGGVAGGFNPSQGFYEGVAINTAITDACVYGGRVYTMTWFTYPKTSQYLICIDEETGEELWRSETIPASDQTLQIVQRATAVLDHAPDSCLARTSGNKIYLIDPNDGRLLQTITFPRSVYAMHSGWNDTIGDRIPKYGSSAGELYAFGATATNAREGVCYVYQFADYGGTIITPKLVWETPLAGGLEVFYGDVFVGRMSDSIMTGINRWTGKVMWTVPHNNYGWYTIGYGKIFNKGNDQYVYAFDLNTGTQLWKSEIPATSFYNQHGMCTGNGLVVQQAYDGVTYAFDVDTGKLAWRYYIGDCPFEPYKSWYGTWPGLQVTIGCQGAFFSQTGDHGLLEPMVPGERIYCMEADTGQLRWSWLAGGNGFHGASNSVADGMVFTCDAYQATLWAIGKGPSAVTVSVPQTKIAKGEYTWITGTVTDQSPAQPGTPCVSAANQQTWMEYLHQGMPKDPTPKTGVPLTLYAQGSDGSTITIGEVTTNGETGEFKTWWVPPAEDIYTITGVFMGDDVYWTSYGSTALAVEGGAASTTSNVAYIPSASTTTMGLTITSLAAVVLGAVVIHKRPLQKKEETQQ